MFVKAIYISVSLLNLCQFCAELASVQEGVCWRTRIVLISGAHPLGCEPTPPFSAQPLIRESWDFS